MKTWQRFLKCSVRKTLLYPFIAVFSFLRKIKSIPVEGMMMKKASAATVTGLSSL